MDPAALRTILFGIIVALLIIPFGGSAVVPGLLLVAGIVVFDLWRQQARRKGPH